MKRSLILAGFLAAAFGQPALAADLTKVDRGIAKEPAYKNKAGYALLVFGPEAKSRVWLVLDGHFKDNPLPKGTIYVDRNANGDLVESGERLEFQSFGDGELTDRAASFGSIAERGLTHEIRELKQVNISSPNEPPIFRIRLLIGGTYVQLAEIEFAESPAKASIYPFDGPLGMLAHLGPQDFRAGEKTVLAAASIGTPGYGPGNPLVKIYSGDFPKELHPVAEVVFPSREADKPLPAVLARLEDRC